MANVNILNLPVSIAINGAEWLEIVQNGVSVRIQAAQIVALSLGSSIPFPISVGGTGATTAAAALTNLGVGSLGLQTASSVAITGGSIVGTTFSGGSIDNSPIGSTIKNTGSFTTVTANAAIAGNLNTGAFSYGTMSFTDTNNIQSMQANVNSYAQIIVQNTNSGAVASSDIIVGNNNATATTYYGNFGINSSGFTGSGSFNLPNAAYLTSTSGDLSIGTTTSNAIHFVVNSGAIDALTISSSGIATFSNGVLAQTLALSGGSITGSGTGSFASVTGTWNTTGVVDAALLVNVTNTASGAGSLLADLQIGGVSQFKVDKTGNVTAGTYNGATLTSTGLNLNNIQLGNNILIWTSGVIGWNTDTYLARRGVANLQFGVADASAPVAQTLTSQSVVAGTSNTAGQNFTIQASAGTGTGAGGSLVFQVAPAGTTGTTQNAFSNAFTIDSTKTSTFYGNIVGQASIASKIPVTTTASTYAMLTTDSSIIYNISATNTTTLLSAASYAGRLLFVKNTAAFAVNSASSNVVPLGSVTAGTAILAATAGKFALLQSDGANWITLLAN